MRYKFILNYRNDYTVEKMCSCLKVSKNAYYHWLKAKDVTKEKASKLHLKARILSIFEESREIYGSARIQKEFPDLVSFNPMVELKPDRFIPLAIYLKTYGLSSCTGISFIDATRLRVCDRRRIHQHKTFKDIAQRG